MLKTIIIKEWKERLPLVVFSLAALLAFVVLFFVLSGNREAVDILAGAAALVFLPVLGLLLGAGGFQSEFRDGAWAYLFSRPISKSRIWLAKYAAQLGILLAVMGSFFLIIKVVPGVQAVFSDLNWILVGFGHNIFIFELGCLGAFVLFNAAFSLSILSDKQPSTIVCSLLLWSFLIFVVVLAVSSPVLIHILFRLNYLPWSLFVLALFSLSMALASILTFSRADFSQPRKKAGSFARRVAAFLATSFVIVAAFLATSFVIGVLLAPIFSWLARAPHYGGMIIAADAAYFRSAKGIFRYDLADARLHRIFKSPLLEGSLSLGGNKIVFVKYVPKSLNIMSTELWIIDTDGRNSERLVDTSHKGGRFFALGFRQAVISPDGRKIAFLASDMRGKFSFHWMDGDGGGARSLPLDIPGIRYYHPIGFSSSADHMILQGVPEARTETFGTSLLRINLDKAAVDLLESNIRTAVREAFRRDLVAYVSSGESGNKDNLIFHDLLTDHRRAVLADDSIGLFGFNEARDKLAVWTGPATHRKLNIYSLTEDRIVAQRDGTRYGKWWPLWVADNLVLLSTDSGTGSQSLAILDERLEEIKTLSLPWESRGHAQFKGSGKTVFAWEHNKPGLWTLDLESMKWRRIH